MLTTDSNTSIVPVYVNIQAKGNKEDWKTKSTVPVQCTVQYSRMEKVNQ
jgi:hypothetical protein